MLTHSTSMHNSVLEYVLWMSIYKSCPADCCASLSILQKKAHFSDCVGPLLLSGTKVENFWFVHEYTFVQQSAKIQCKIEFYYFKQLLNTHVDWDFNSKITSHFQFLQKPFILDICKPLKQKLKIFYVGPRRYSHLSVLESHGRPG